MVSDKSTPAGDDWEDDDVRRYLAEIGRSDEWDKYEHYKFTGRLQATLICCLNGSPMRMPLPPLKFADHGFPTIHGNLTDGRITVSARAVKELFPPSEAPWVAHVGTPEAAAIGHLRRLLEAVGIVPHTKESTPTADTPGAVATRKTRRVTKEIRVLEILRELDCERRVRDDMQPADVEKRVRPHYRKQHGDDTKVSRRVIGRAYQKFLKERPAK